MGSKREKREKTEDEILYDRIVKRITKQYERRGEYLGHLVAYTISSIVAWVFLELLAIGEGWATAGMIFMGLWTIGIVIHTGEILMTELRERAIRAELSKAGLLHYHDPQVKAKRRERLVTLSDDGELVDYDYDEDDFAEQYARS